MKTQTWALTGLLALTGAMGCADDTDAPLIAAPDCDASDDPSSMARCEGAQMPDWMLENIQEDHPRYGQVYGLYDPEFDQRVVLFSLFAGW